MISEKVFSMSFKVHEELDYCCGNKKNYLIFVTHKDKIDRPFEINLSKDILI